MTRHARTAAVIATAWALGTATAMAADIAYISSASGYMVHDSGGTAVTANWAGQAPIQGFSGYGQVKLNNRCLTTSGPAGQALRWQTCKRGDKSQIWALSNKRLNNELGWCADVEGNRQGAGARLVAWKCHGAANQQFKGHQLISAQKAAAQIRDPGVKQAFIRNAQNARPGQIISQSSGQLLNVGVGGLISAGGMNLIVISPGNLIAAGGMN